MHFGGECVLEFIARLTQAGAQINEARSHDQALRVDGLTGSKAVRRGTDGSNFFPTDENTGLLVKPRGRVDDATARDRDVIFCCGHVCFLLDMLLGYLPGF